MANYTKEKPPSAGGTRGSPVTLSCIAEFSRLLRPVGPGPCLSTHLRATALTARTGYRLGEPLPHQQPDRTRPHPQATLEACIQVF